jgi:riboflavin-specific deaminase-like protein
MEPLETWLAASSTRLSNPHRPLVTLSYAQSRDGSIARKRGEPTSISSPESLEMTHRLRAAHDAILVGIGTVLSDDPQLTVRAAPGRSPRPVVLDSQLRTPPAARLLDQRAALIFCAVDAPHETAAALSAPGAQIERQPSAGRIDLASMLTRLGELGIRTLMVEGGGEVIASFVNAGLADRVVLTTAPVELDGYKPIDPPLHLRPLRNRGEQQFGADTVTWGEL